MGRRRKSYSIPHILSLVVLSLISVAPQIWFFLPTAVAVLFRKKNWAYRSATILLFVVGVVLILTSPQGVLSELDLLALFLLFLQGICIPYLRNLRNHHVAAIMAPLIIGILSSFFLYVSSRIFGDVTSFQAWAIHQLGSDVLPYFTGTETLPVELVDFYKNSILPMMASGLLAWFGCLVAMTFFINGILENLLWTLDQGQRKIQKVNFWQSFGQWRAPDSILIFLVFGLGALVLAKFAGGRFTPALMIGGWHLTITILFPIFVQGMALAYYLIPRVSMIGFVMIFVLLLAKPIPVLVLAGLLDLWFDFRSKIRPDPDAEV